MIPSCSDVLLTDIEEYTQPSKTYKLNIEKDTISGGYITGTEALKQAIYKILNTERYDYIMYSWNYGIELKNLIGEPTTYVIPELERVISEALLQDDRIEEVTDFEFETDRNVITVNFTVVATDGSTVEVEKVVSV